MTYAESALRPAPLTVLSLRESRKALADPHLDRFFSAVVSVGIDLAIKTSLPVCRVLKTTALSADEFAAATTLATDAWQQHQRVLFHCELGQSRSPAMAVVLVAGYFGPQRHAEAQRWVERNVQSGKLHWNEAVIQCAVPLVTEEATAVWLAETFLDATGRRFALKLRDHQRKAALG